MKKFTQTSVFILLGIGSVLYSQVATTADCEGAIPIVGNMYDQPVYTYAGEADSMEINGTLSCLNLGEQHGYWFEFLVLNAGTLAFNIVPHQLTEDYDWALFNVTDYPCVEIRNIDSQEVRCNFSGLPGITGVNGLSGAQNEPLYQVDAGEFYKLYLTNLNSSTNGFLLDFEASTCTFNPILGFNSNELADPIRLGPNPTAGQFTLHLDKNITDEIAWIRIADFYGKTIIEKNGDMNSILSFDITGEAAGMYFVQIVTPNKHYNYHLILQ
jgi:hypothetical protein